MQYILFYSHLCLVNSPNLWLLQPIFLDFPSYPMISPPLCLLYPIVVGEYFFILFLLLPPILTIFRGLKMMEHPQSKLTWILQVCSQCFRGFIHRSFIVKISVFFLDMKNTQLRQFCEAAWIQRRAFSHQLIHVLQPAEITAVSRFRMAPSFRFSPCKSWQGRMRMCGSKDGKMRMFGM